MKITSSDPRFRTARLRDLRQASKAIIWAEGEREALIAEAIAAGRVTLCPMGVAGGAVSLDGPASTIGANHGIAWHSGFRMGE
jgi:hypothetical protein